MTEASHQMASNPLPPGGAVRGIGRRRRPAPRSAIVDDDGGDARRRARPARSRSAAPASRRLPATTPRRTPSRSSTAGSAPATAAALDDGYLRLAGRLKEMIIRGGENISPLRDRGRCCSPTRPWPRPSLRRRRRQVRRDRRRRGRRWRRRRRGRAAAPLPGARWRRSRCRAHPRRRRDPAGRRPARCSAARMAAHLERAAVRFAVARRRRDRRLRRRRARARRRDVTLDRARRAPARRCSEHGVRVLSPRGDFTAHPPATDDLDAIGRGRRRLPRPQGLQPARARARARRARCGRATAVVAGAERLPWWYFQCARTARSPGARSRASIPAARSARAIPPERVVGCVVYCSTEIVEPGVIRHVEGTRFSIGEPDGVATERCGAISEALVAAGLKCPVESSCATRSG